MVRTLLTHNNYCGNWPQPTYPLFTSQKHFMRKIEPGKSLSHESVLQFIAKGQCVLAFQMPFDP